MNKLPSQCPVCQNELIVTELYCDHCATTIAGQFEMLSSPLNQLNAKQLEFILTFIRCEGKFNRMEETLGISYPTLRNRFNEILDAMGYSSRIAVDLDENKDTRMEILRSLEKGKIEPGDAEAKLSKL